MPWLGGCHVCESFQHSSVSPTPFSSQPGDSYIKWKKRRWGYWWCHYPNMQRPMSWGGRPDGELVLMLPPHIKIPQSWAHLCERCIGQGGSALRSECPTSVPDLWQIHEPVSDRYINLEKAAEAEEFYNCLQGSIWIPWVSTEHTWRKSLIQLCVIWIPAIQVC